MLLTNNTSSLNDGLLITTIVIKYAVISGYSFTGNWISISPVAVPFRKRAVRMTFMAKQFWIQSDTDVKNPRLLRDPDRSRLLPKSIGVELLRSG